MMCSRPSPRNGVLLAALLVTACGQPSGTETGNPVVQRPPYESPTDFTSGDPVVPGCPPPVMDTMPRRGPYWAGVGDGTIVGASRAEGLSVIDVSDAQAPTLLAVLPLHGEVLAVVASGSDVAVLLREPPDLATERIATAAELEFRLRLVHVDVSDPNRPSLVGDVELDGEYWDVRTRDGTLWLMSAATVQPDACQLPGYGCGFLARTAMRVNGYRFSSKGFETVADVELPAPTRAWASDDGFVVETDSSEDATHRLAVVRIVGGTLEVSERDGTTSPAFGSPVGVVGDRLYVLNDAGTTSTLEVIDVSGAAAETLSQVTDLPERPQTATFEANRVIIGNSDYTQAGVVVSLEDPTAPVVTRLPDGVAKTMPVEVNGEGALLGWGDADLSGKLTIGLVLGDAAADGAALVQALRTDLTPPSGSPEDAALYHPQTVGFDDAVAFLYHYYEPTARHSAIGVLDLSTDPIALSTYEASHGDELVSVGSWVYAPGVSGVSGVSLDVTEPGATDVAFDHDERLFTVDALPAGDRTLSVVFTLDGAQLVVTDEAEPGVEIARFRVPNTARRLLPLGDRVVLLADNHDDYCEQHETPCDEPGVVIIEPEGPEIVGRWPLPNPQATLTSSTTTHTNGWVEPVQLDNGSWVLGLVQSSECLLVAECEQLGITPVPLAEANVAFGSVVQDCPPDVDPCELPSPPPDPEVYGKRTTLDLYRLGVDSGEGAGLEIVELGRSTLELVDSDFAPLRRSGNTVLVTRLELKVGRGATRNTNARFMLDAFDADAPATAGDLGPDTASLLAGVNVPGVVVGLANEGQVIYTSEPPLAEGENATLYRLQMTDGEALVTAKRTLPGRYGDVRVVDDIAFYIEQGEDSCMPGAVYSIALDDTLTQLGSTPLTGGNWDYVESGGGKLLLRGPNYGGYALFDATETPVVLDEFQPATVTGEFVHIHDGEVWGAE